MFINLAHFYSSTPTPSYQAIAHMLRKRGHRVWIAQPDHTGAFVWRDGDEIVHRQPGMPPRVPVRLAGFQFMLHVREFLGRVKPDIVQVTPAHWSVLLALAKPSRTRFLLDVRTAGSGSGNKVKGLLNDTSAQILWRFASRWVYDHTLFLNAAGAEWLLGNQWSRYASIVPLGVDERFLRFEHKLKSFDANAPVRFIYVGSISRVRYLEQIILAVDILHARTDKFLVLLVGADDGLMQSKKFYRVLIQERGLERLIQIADSVPYELVPVLLAEHDVALNYVPANPVLRRQTSMKVLECRALGLPQISTRTRPNAESILDGANGLLVDDTPEALAEAMYRFVSDIQWREQRWHAAQKMRSGVTWNEVADKYLDIYQRLLKCDSPKT